MGTVADKLQAVLDSKNAIKEKFSLPDDMPFSQYADNINASGGGGAVIESMDFYRCQSVLASSSEPPLVYDTWKALILNVNTPEAELMYLTDPDSLDTDRIWQNKDGNHTVFYKDNHWVHRYPVSLIPGEFLEAVVGTGNAPDFPFFPYYDEIKLSGPVNANLRLVWDMDDPNGYYYRSYGIGSGNVNWGDYGIKVIDGKWCWYYNSDIVPTNSEMPFYKDGSSVVWPGSDITATAKNLIPGLWDWGMLSLSDSPNDTLLADGDFFMAENGNFYNEKAVGSFVVYEGADFSSQCYTTGNNWLVDLPKNSIPFQLRGTWTDENDTAHSEYVGMIVRGGYRNPAKLYMKAKSVTAIQTGFTPVVLTSGDGGQSFASGDWSLSGVDGNYILVSDTENPGTFNMIWPLHWGNTMSGVGKYFPCYYPNIDSSAEAEYQYSTAGYALSAAVILDLPYIAEKTVIVSGCSLEGVNGLYNRYENADFPLAYFVRDNYDNQNGSVYIVFKDGRWVFAGTPTGDGVIMSQHDKCVDLQSINSVYLLNGETYPTESYNDRGTTSAYVRYGAEGEKSVEGSIGNITWAGYQAYLDENGEYSYSDVLTPDLVKTGFIPVPGNIYSENTKIQVEQLYGDDSGKFFLCNYVNRTYLSYNKIVASGMPETPFVGATYLDQSDWSNKDLPSDVANRNPNGTYILTNPDAEYVSNYIWKCEETGCVMMPNTMMGMGEFYIWPGQEYQNTSKYVYEKMDMSPSGDHYPAPSDYTSYVWQYYDGSSTTVLENGSVAVPIPDAVEQYWEGYRMEQDVNGKWFYHSDIVRLEYKDYMPVPGRIYDAACTMEIVSVDWRDDFKWSCPHDMLSNENDEWVLSLTGTLTDSSGYALWHGFDNVRDTYFQPSGNGYIQWQNKLRPVVLREIYINCGGRGQGGYWELLGSNDGENWVPLITKAEKWTCTNVGTWDGSYKFPATDPKYKWTITKNIPPYYYYRFGGESASFGSILYVEATGFPARQVPVFEGE